MAMLVSFSMAARPLPTPSPANLPPDPMAVLTHDAKAGPLACIGSPALRYPGPLDCFIIVCFVSSMALQFVSITAAREYMAAGNYCRDAIASHPMRLS